MNWYTYSAFGDEIDKDLTVQMDFLENLGINHIEPRGVNGKNISLYTPEEAKELKKQFDARGFKASAIGSPIGKLSLTDPLDEDLKLFENVMEIAKIFETPYIRVFSCYIPEGDDPLKHRDEVLRRMKAYADAARGKGLILLHENEGGPIYGQTAERCVDIIESIGSDIIRATYDAGNFAFAGIDAYKAYKVLEKYVEYIHIKDSIGDGVVVPAGHGNVQYKEILTELKNSGKHFYMTLEPHLGMFEGFEDIEHGRRILGKGNNKDNFVLAFESIKKIVDSL